MKTTEVLDLDRGGAPVTGEPAEVQKAKRKAQTVLTGAREVLGLPAVVEGKGGLDVMPKITTPEQLQAAGEFLTTVIKPTEKLIRETFDPMVKAQDAALKVIRGKRDEALAPVSQAEVLLKSAIGDYHVRAERARQAIAERERQRAAEQERQRRELEDAGKPVPVALMPVPVAPEREQPRVSGVAVKKVPKFEVLDKSQLGDLYLEADLVKIGKIVRAHGHDAVEVVSRDAKRPAIRVWMVPEVAAGAREG